MKRLLLTVLLASTSWGAFAQQTHDLSPEELEAFKVQCQERVDAFQMGLEIIGDKRQDAEIKNHYIKTLPEMFMGNGDKWTGKDEHGYNVEHEAAKMQVSSWTSGREIIRDVPLKEYLSNLRNLPYTYVEIKKAQTCMISNLYKVRDNLYMATCTFFQYFTGRYGETAAVISDKTQKDVDVYIQRVEDGSLGTYWDMKFGDIKVAETIDLNK